MAIINEKEVLKALRTVEDPDLKKDIVSLNFIKDLKIIGKEVNFTLELTTPACPVRDSLKKECETAVKNNISDVEKVNVETAFKVPVHENDQRAKVIPGVKNTIAVASGKGGVGKSTIAVNLATALARCGAKVGLIDTDVYGPSAPLMMGIREKPVVRNQKLVPLEAHGVKVMSIGFLVDEEQAVIWRGPMASGAVKQFMTDVDWGELDYLIFDLPPGTGDVQLTLVQTIPLTGAVIVTTPQDVALADARKGLRMFERVNVPVFGIVENMSYYICPGCGHREEIFSYGGGKRSADLLGTEFLGEIPIYTKIREGGDKGIPIAVLESENEVNRVFISMAERVAAEVSKLHFAQDGKGGSIEISV